MRVKVELNDTINVHFDKLTLEEYRLFRAAIAATAILNYPCSVLNGELMIIDENWLERF